jgi:hypothetical protein
MTAAKVTDVNMIKKYANVKDRKFEMSINLLLEYFIK